MLYNLEKDPLEQTPLTDLRLFEKCREQLKSYFKEKEFIDAFNADGELIAVEYAKPPCIGFIDQSPYWPETVLE